MIDRHGNTLWTYRSQDGSKTEQVYNPARGVLPDFIILKVDNVTTGTLDRASESRQAGGYAPPVGMRVVGAWSPPAPDPAVHVQTAVGWPGMTQVS
jgi:hypothetical protein